MKLFDGDIHSLGGDHGYDRGVVVSTAAVAEIMEKVNSASALVRELANGS